MRYTQQIPEKWPAHVRFRIKTECITQTKCIGKFFPKNEIFLQNKHLHNLILIFLLEIRFFFHFGFFLLDKRTLHICGVFLKQTRSTTHKTKLSSRQMCISIIFLFCSCRNFFLCVINKLFQTRQKSQAEFLLKGNAFFFLRDLIDAGRHAITGYYPFG